MLAASERLHATAFMPVPRVAVCDVQFKLKGFDNQCDGAFSWMPVT